MNRRYTFQDIVAMMATATGKEKSDIETFLKTLMEVVQQHTIKDKLVKIKGLGTFKVTTVEARESIHVNTNERILIPAHSKISFIPDKELAEQINKPFSFFETTEVKDDVTFDDLEEQVESLTSTTDESEDIKPIEPVISEEIVEVSKPEESEAINDEVKEEVTSEIPQNQEEKTSLCSEENIEVLEEKDQSVAEETSASPEIYKIIEEEVHDEVSQATSQCKETNKRNNRYITFFVILISILAIINVALYLNPQLFNKDKLALTTNAHQTTNIQEIDTIMEIDSSQIIPSKTDSLLSKEESPATELVRITITQGARLTSLAKKYYGHKIFWVYIYEHNKNIINNPNNIPIGTTIEIPDAKQYDINANDSASIKKASQMQTEILNNNYK